MTGYTGKVLEGNMAQANQMSHAYKPANARDAVIAFLGHAKTAEPKDKPFFVEFPDNQPPHIFINNMRVALSRMRDKLRKENRPVKIFNMRIRPTTNPHVYSVQFVVSRTQSLAQEIELGLTDD